MAERDLLPPRCTSVAAALVEHARLQRDAVAFNFAEPDDHAGAEPPASAQLTFGDLHEQARAIAARLGEDAEPGDRALLLCPPGPAYVAALFGCFYAGLIAVPAYPPIAAGADERLRRVFDDASPRIVLTTDSLSALYEKSGLRAVADTSGTTSIEVDRVEALIGPPTCADFDRDPASVALLQYTSGSTGSPRGVMLTHANIASNIAAMLERTGATSADRGVFWLPPYHDMGLIGGIFLPIFVGGETIVLSPLAFLRDPLVWLDTISRYRAGFSGAPNFAYDLCVRKASPDRIAHMDLSSWKGTVNGAEPVRASTMERFAECFAPAGFSATAFMPGYGLAEATLMVAASPPGAVFGVSAAEVSGPSDGRAEEQPRRAPFVSVGTAIRDTVVRIVDPHSRRPCADGVVGEIWLAGPGVAYGYWEDPTATNTTFGAKLAGAGDETFLRTGDLGMVRGAELYVTGRLKDVIIVRGQNHYPQDIEDTVGRADGRLRPGCTAAFETELDGERGVVVVQECRALVDDAAVQEIATKVRRLVAQEHGLSVRAVVLIAQGTSLKTSSGKIRRQPTRNAFLNHELDVIAIHRSIEDVQRDEGAASAPPSVTESVIMQAFAEVLGHSGVTRNDDFFTLGGDSLNAVELVAAAEARGVAIEPHDVYRFPSPSLLAEEISRQPGGAANGIAERAAVSARTLRSEIPRVEDRDSYPLSPIQRRWATDYLGDRSKTWGNVVLRLPLEHAGRVAEVEAAISQVWFAHESLRTLFPSEDGTLRQRILPSPSVPVALHDVRDHPPEERAAAISAVAAREASTVFDLARGPAARATLVRTSDTTAEIQLTLHHMLADGWSVLAMREQLLAAYRGATRRDPVTLQTPAVRYRDYASWMLELERGDALTDARSYWLAELDGDLPDTMPVDERVARGPETRGANVLTILPSEFALALKNLASSSRRSLTALLYGAFFLALQRRTGQSDLIIGTPLAGRDRRDIRDVIGMFINLVPIRLRFRRGWQLPDVAEATQEKLLGAMTHQRYQLDNIVCDLDIEREPHRFPVTNTFFTKLDMGGQRLGPQTGYTTSGKLATDVRFNMMLYVYDFEDGLILDCKYRDKLFAADEVRALMDAYIALLRSAVSG